MSGRGFIVRETIINESKIYFDRISEDCITYRVLEINLTADNRQHRVYGIQVEEFTGGDNPKSFSEKLENFSSSLSEAIEFINLLIRHKTNAEQLFDFALGYLALKIDRLSEEKTAIVNS